MLTRRKEIVQEDKIAAMVQKVCKQQQEVQEEQMQVREMFQQRRTSDFLFKK